MGKNSKKQSAKVTKSSKKATESVKAGKANLVIESPTLDLTTKGGKTKKSAKGKSEEAYPEAPEMVEDETTNAVQETTAAVETEVAEAQGGDVDRSHPDFKVQGMTDEVHRILQRNRANFGEQTTQVVADEPQLSKKERKALAKAAANTDSLDTGEATTVAPKPEAETTGTGRAVRTTQLQRELPGAVKQANKRKEPIEIVLDRKYKTKFNAIKFAKALVEEGTPATGSEEHFPEDQGYYIVTITVYPKGTKVVDNKVV